MIPYVKYTGLSCLVAAVVLDSSATASSMRGRVLGGKQKSSIPSINSAPACDYAVDLVFAQDASTSFDPHINNIKEYFPQVVTEISKLHIGSQFKQVSFTDVPFFPFGCGIFGDTPFREDTDWTTDPEVFREAISRMALLWGVDFEEAQLVVLNHIPASGMYRKEKYTPEGNPIQRFLVMSTDASYHVEGDVKNATQEWWEDVCAAYNYDWTAEQPYCCDKPPNKLDVRPFTGDGVLRFGYDGSNIFEDYPAIDQVAKALADENVFVIFLVAKPPSRDRPMEAYETLKERFDAAGVYTDVLELTDKSGNLREAILQGLKTLEEAICSPPTTAAPTTTTEAPTTTTEAPTTTTEAPTTTTESVAVPPPVGTNPPATEPPATNPPATEPSGSHPTETVPPSTDTSDDGSTTSSKAPHQTSTTEAAQGTSPAIIVGAAAGGAAAAAIAGVVAAKFAGVGAFGSATPPPDVITQMDMPEAAVDREVMQEVGTELFI